MEYDFQIEYNGLTLDYDNGFIIHEIDGIDNPEIRISQDELTGRDGGNIWARLYAMRGIAIMGTVFGSDHDDFFAKKKALIQAFNRSSDDWLVVTLWNGQSRRINAKSIALPDMPMRAAEVDDTEFRVEVLCEDPYWKDNTEETHTAVLVEPAGLVIPFTLPATIPSSSFEDTITINNTGDIEVYPYIKITGAVNTPVVKNITTGEQFTINENIDSGDYIELYVDTRGKVVLKNGTEKYWSYLIGDFITIQSGLNQLVFDAASYSDEAELYVAYSNKYESIQ